MCSEQLKKPYSNSCFCFEMYLDLLLENTTYAKVDRFPNHRLQIQSQLSSSAPEAPPPVFYNKRGLG